MSVSRSSSRYLRANIGNEVFLVVCGEDADLFKGCEIKIFNDIMSMIEDMQYMSPNDFEVITILHGIISTAETLPPSLKNVDPFIICQQGIDPEDPFVLDVRPVNEVQDLAISIEQLISNEHDSSVFMPFLPEMNDVYILYGSELQASLTFVEDEVDESLIEEAKEIYSTSKTVAEKAELKREERGKL